MNTKNPDNGFEMLAEAIIMQAVKDYKNADDPKKHIDKKEIENFFESEWFTMLTSIDRDYFLSLMNMSLLSVSE